MDITNSIFDFRSYNDVLRYYMKSEKANLKRLPKDAPYHGRDGELPVENVSFRYYYTTTNYSL